MFTKPEESSRF